MKTAIAWGLAGVLAMGAAACSSPEEVSEKVGVYDSGLDGDGSVAVPQPPAPPAPPPAEAVDFTDNAKQGEAARDFAYGWPKQASAIPPLAAMLSERRDDALSQQKKEWDEALAEFGPEGCISCTNREYSLEWKLVTDTPRFLSLSGEGYLYTGGAHGMPLLDTLVWDREARAGEGDTVAVMDMFTSADAITAAVQGPFCAALDKERKERRGEYYEPGGMFTECPGLDELVILLGSSNKKAINRIGLIAPPYVAGPYVEGSYEVTVPVTSAVLDAVKPRYKDAFAVQ